jgi:hypothetical protein
MFGGIHVRARFGFCLLAIALVGCTYDPISYMTELRQPLDRMLVVGPGDVLIRVDRFRSLENNVGKADIFGRRTNEGYTEVRFSAIESDGTLVLLRNDYVIVTNENAESRLLFQFSSSTTTRNTQSSGNFTQNTFATRTAQKDDFHELIPMEPLQIRLPQGSRSFVFEGYIVSFETVEPTAVTYRLARNPLAFPEPSPNMP